MSEQLPDGIREIAAGQVERLADLVAGLSDADLVAPTLCSGQQGSGPGDVPASKVTGRNWRRPAGL